MKTPLSAALPDVDYNAVGRRVRQLRKQRHITQADLAKLIGLSTSFVGHIERGTRIPSLVSMLRISNVLHTTVDELLTGLPHGGETRRTGTREMRILNDIMNVLYKYAGEWIRHA